MDKTPVMILNWNGWADTFTCLESIASVDEDVEVWLVDNGSEDDRSAGARMIYPGLRVLRWDTNYGWSGGYNRALQVAAREGYEFAYLLNNDSTVTPGFLSNAVEVARSQPQAAAVGSCIAWANPSGYVMFDGDFHAGSEQPLVDNRPTRHVSTLSGAAMLVRLGAAARDGYFDERFFCYFEETEWCLRMRDRGWHILVAGDSLTVHEGLRSDTSANRQYYFHRNQFLMLERPDYRRLYGGRLRLVYRTLRAANEARRRGQNDDASALAAAAYDGLLKRFGRRSAPPPRAIENILTHCWPVRSGFFRDRYHLARKLVGNLG